MLVGWWVPLWHWLLLVFQRGDMVGRRWALLVSFFSDCFMEEAYEGGLDVFFNYGSGRRPQGLSWVGIVFISKNIFEPHLSYFTVEKRKKTFISKFNSNVACFFLGVKQCQTKIPNKN